MCKECRDCNSTNCQCRDIIPAVVNLLRVIDKLGTRRDEIDAMNRLRMSAIALGYIQAEEAMNDAD